MNIAASAPGKLVLLGEYAVLEGGCGLVMAVDRQARVSLTGGRGEGLTVAAPPLQSAPVGARIGADRLHWANGHGLPLVDAVIASLNASDVLERALNGRALTLDSTDFFAAAGVKLGLGSSAALCTALLGVLSAATPRRQPPTLSDALSAHRRFQHGTGSGIDVAASFHGGVLQFRRDDDEKTTVRHLDWPPGLHGYGVFSGRPASTTDRLARLGAFRGEQAATYRSLMTRLKRNAETGVKAFAAADVEAFLDSAQAFAQALADLGRRANLALETPAHRELAEIGARCGVSYKTSGAGGGDFGLGLSASRERAERFATEAVGTGRLVLPLVPCAAGLTVSGHRTNDLR